MNGTDRILLRRRMRAQLDLWKRTQGCSHCGARDGVLAYHHVRGEKAEKLSRMLDWSLEAIVNEIGKCIVLCEDCHRKEHQRMGNWGRPRLCA